VNTWLITDNRDPDSRMPIAGFQFTPVNDMANEGYHVSFAELSAETRDGHRGITLKTAVG
jgi:hypothetical protein